MAAKKPQGPSIMQLSTPAAQPAAPTFNVHRDWREGHIVTVGDNSLTWEVIEVLRYDDGAIAGVVLKSGQTGRTRSELPERLKMFRESAAPKKELPPLAEDEVRAVCPSCQEHLGDFHKDGGMSAQWWASEILREHAADHHG